MAEGALYQVGFDRAVFEVAVEPGQDSLELTAPPALAITPDGRKSSAPKIHAFSRIMLTYSPKGGRLQAVTRCSPDVLWSASFELLADGMVRRMDDGGASIGDPIPARVVGLNVDGIAAPHVYSLKYKFRMSDNTGGMDILMGIGYAVRSRPVVKTSSDNSWQETDQGWSEFVDQPSPMVDAEFESPESPSAVSFPDK